MTKPKGGWDRPGIVAELHRRGLTLTRIALDAGRYESICRLGIVGRSREGAQLIADALGLPLEELFPNQYLRTRGQRPHANRNTRGDGSAKARPRTDTARGAA